MNCSKLGMFLSTFLDFSVLQKVFISKAMIDSLRRFRGSDFAMSERLEALALEKLDRIDNSAALARTA